MLLADKRPVKIFEKVSVARQMVYTWKGLLDDGSIDALRAVPSREMTARVSVAQLEEVRRAVLQNPTEYGFDTELWTLNRVDTVIECQYRVK
jgi:hypothetical protein